MTSRSAPPVADGSITLSLSERLRQARNSRRASSNKPEAATVATAANVEDDGAPNDDAAISKSKPLAERYRPYSTTDAKSATGSQVSALSSAEGSTRSWRNIHALVQKLDETVESNGNSHRSVVVPSSKPTSYTMAADTAPQPAWKYRNLHTLTSSKSGEDHSSVHSTSTSNSTPLTDNEAIPSVPSSSKYASSESTTNVVNRWNQRTAATKQEHSKAVAAPVLRKWTPPASTLPAEATTKAPAAPHSYVPVTQYSFVPSPTTADRNKSPRDDPTALSLATSYSFASQASSRRSESPLKGGRSPLAATSEPPKEVIATSRSVYASPPAPGTNSVEPATVPPAWKSRLKGGGESLKKKPPAEEPMVPAWKKKLQEQRKLQQEQQQLQQSVPKWKKKAAEEIAPSASSVTDIASLPSDEAGMSAVEPESTPVYGRRVGNPPVATLEPPKAAWFARTHPEHTASGAKASPSRHVYPSAAESLPSEETVSPEKDDPAEKLGIGETITSSVSAHRLRLRKDAVVTQSTRSAGWPKAKEEGPPAKPAPFASNAYARGKTPVVFPSQSKSADSVGKFGKPAAVPRPALPIVPSEPKSQSVLNVADASNDVVDEEGDKKVSVAEMKAKLWGGNGKSEKLVTTPPRVKGKDHVGDAVFSSPLRSKGNATLHSVATSSPSKTVINKTPVVSPLLPKSTRGRPDVCTPNGPLPPPRGRQEPPPRKNMDTLWLKRMEQATQSDDAPLSPPKTDVPSADVDPGGEVMNPPGNEALEPPAPPANEESPPPPPPMEQTSNHHRSPSLGDFQIASNPSKKIVIEDVSYEMASPPVSPRMTRDPISPTIRPAVMPKWDSPKSGSTSPTSRPPKLPPTSPLPTEPKEKAGFVETIDGPPLDDATAAAKWGGDADMTGPQEEEAVEPLSPRPKPQDRPWTKDSGALSPTSWRKSANSSTEADFTAAATRLDSRTDSATVAEEKKCSDSPTSSLVRMAADSIHAVEYEQAVLGLQRPSVMEDDDDDSVQSVGAAGSSIPAVVPPEFASAIAEPVEAPVPIFGDPASFGAAGGEATAEPIVTVADRAKAIASWNGGLGVAPTVAKTDQNPMPSEEIASSLSPIRHETSDTEVDGMSPRVSKRGFGIDDWNRNKSFDSRSEHETSSDFWQPSSLDHPVDDRDWSKYDPEIDGVPTSKSDDVSKETADTSTRLPPPRRGGTPPLLSKPKSDTDPKPKMTWRKKPLIPKSESSTPPRQATTKMPNEAKQVPSTQSPSSVWKDKAMQATENVAFEAFDPFEYSFNGGEKVEFTETTEFTENTDMFESVNGDPFVVDPSSFPTFEPKLVAPPSGGDDGYEEDSDSIPNISSLARPSGSSFGQYELWSYDADTSGLHEGAAEI